MFSRKWRDSFLHLHGFDPVRPSNVRSSDLKEVATSMSGFVMQLRALSKPLPDALAGAEAPEEGRDPKRWFQPDPEEGRFPKCRRLNGDQVPCSFVFAPLSIWATQAERKERMVKFKTPSSS